MKKLICILLSLMLITLASACTNDTGEESVSELSTEEQSSEAEESSEEEKPEYDKLRNTFGKLWSGDYYYIDVRMIVESADTTVSGQESGAEKTEYSYQIAVDQISDRAMLNMNTPDGTTGHLLINGKKCYKLDDGNKEYSEQEYPYNAKRFGEIYTTDIYLGMMNYLTPESCGKKSFQADEQTAPEELDYEQYRLTPDSDASDAVTEAHITYYFKNDIPYAEVLETDKGKTTFIFKEITDKPVSYKIFELPSDYTHAA